METKLVALQIELTNKCALDCAECPRRLMSRAIGSMDFGLLEILVSDGMKYSPTMGFNVNGLGEPLLYKQFGEAVQLMDEAGTSLISLFTSLVAAPKVIEAAAVAFEKAKVPIQLAVTKHVYDAQGNVQTADEPFDTYLERYMALPDHVDKHLGIVLNKYHSEDDVKQFEEKYAEKVPPNNLHIITQLNPWFNTVSDMASVTHGPDAAHMSPGVCDYPFQLLHVGWDGDCIVCCYDDIHGEGIMGHIESEGDLARVWEGEVYEEMRRKHNSYDISMKPCNHCERTAWSRVEGFYKSAVLKET